MSAHLSTEQIENYRRRTLTVAMLIATDKHLAACDACRARLDEGGAADRAASLLRAGLLRDDSTSDHLAYDLLEKYVDARADRVDCEIVESHVRFCPQCARELNDLRSFASMMAKGRELKAASIGQAGKRPAEKIGWFERVFGSGSRMRVAALVTAAVFFVAVTASVLVIMQSRNGVPSDQAAVNSNSDAMARKGNDAKGNSNVALPPLPDSSDPVTGLARKPALSPDSTTLTLTLAAGQATAFELPSSVRSVNLSLNGFKDGGKNYSLKLTEAGGKVIWQQDVVKIRDDIFITIPASDLGGGQYTLTASSGKGETRFRISVIKR